jgi:hypothetical protein
MEREVQVRTMTASDREVLVPMFARAFTNDPLTSWFALNDERRAWRIQQVFHWYFDQALPLGLSHTAADGCSAAL